MPQCTVMFGGAGGALLGPRLTFQHLFSYLTHDLPSSGRNAPHSRKQPRAFQLSSANENRVEKTVEAIRGTCKKGSAFPLRSTPRLAPQQSKSSKCLWYNHTTAINLWCYFGAPTHGSGCTVLLDLSFSSNSEIRTECLTHLELAM